MKASLEVRQEGEGKTNISGAALFIGQCTDLHAAQALKTIHVLRLADLPDRFNFMDPVCRSQLIEAREHIVQKSEGEVG